MRLPTPLLLTLSSFLIRFFPKADICPNFLSDWTPRVAIWPGLKCILISSALIGVLIPAILRANSSSFTLYWSSLITGRTTDTASELRPNLSCLLTEEVLFLRPPFDRIPVNCFFRAGRPLLFTSVSSFFYYSSLRLRDSPRTKSGILNDYAETSIDSGWDPKTLIWMAGIFNLSLLICEFDSTLTFR